MQRMKKQKIKERTEKLRMIRMKSQDLVGWWYIISHSLVHMQVFSIGKFTEKKTTKKVSKCKEEHFAVGIDSADKKRQERGC